MSSTLKLVLVAVAIAILVMLNLYRYDHPISVSPLAKKSISADRTLLNQEAGDVQSIEQLAELKFVQTYSRPLFSEDRRKYTKPKKPAKKKQAPKKVVKKAATPTPPPNFQILGISLSTGNNRTLVKLKTSPDPEWIEQGDTINGWKVQEITKDAVKIVKADREIFIALYPENQ